MGLPVTVYRHTDVGAPVGRPTIPADWIAILKACLVDGYGAKQPLGWTLEFSNETTSAFKNSVIDGGSGCFFTIEDLTGGASQGNFDITIAKSMTDINTYVDKVQSRRYRTYNSSAGVLGWTIIGTSRGFWMITVNATSGALDTLQTYFLMNAFIGDIESFTPNDNAPFGILSGISTTGDSTSVTTTAFLGNTDKIYMTHLSSDGSAGKVEYSYIFTSKTTTTDGGDIDVVNVPAILTTPLLCGIGGNGSPSFNLCRGKIAGLYELQHAGCQQLTYPIVRTFDGEQYEAIVGNKVPIFWIRISGNWYE
ncbi:hypothetical protein ACRN9C_20460 [Shewanella frigidimarina]|uniref:Uncharacterized protein n=1 Tax=Shewanella polaris TaxID=2588449 RepID=A0A4Y5YID6_9GAMM|nr:hypothetical protein [Shewanella polaris]QDE32375.1 hypothetical protein FH971_16235 [Shewanella polaris]